ncbi:MAG TPA: cupin domain-containing protein [Rhizomicrobium sp.]|jgi:ribosomal protein L16 Arg81 hydroxylase
MEFDHIIAPLSREKFLRDHWSKSFARMQGPADRFAHLFNWDELNAVLEQHRLAPPRVKLFKDGQPVDPARYVTPPHLGTPRLDSGGLAVCLAEGATLILNDAQEVSPKLRVLMQTFQDALHTDTFTNLYAAWHSQKAFDMHWDPQDSIVLQVSGKKRWKVYKPTRLHPLEDDIEKPAQPTGEPVWEGVMKEGDAIYIPRGWWHVVFPLNEPSLHLTVSLTPPKGIDFLGWAVSKLRREAQVRADLPVLKGEEAQAAQLKVLRGLLNDAMSDGAMTEFLAQWNANIGHSPHINLPHAPYEQFAEIADSSRVRLATLHRLALAPYGDNFEFRAVGKLWTVPRALVPALSRLHNARAHSVAELSEALTTDAEKADLKKSLAVLARAGLVLVEKGT